MKIQRYIETTMTLYENIVERESLILILNGTPIYMAISIIKDNKRSWKVFAFKHVRDRPIRLTVRPLLNKVLTMCDAIFRIGIETIPR